MTPIDFEGRTHLLAKDQDEYITLPIEYHDDAYGTITSCWKLSFWERITVLFTGVIWHDELTFHTNAQPVLLKTSRK